MPSSTPPAAAEGVYRWYVLLLLTLVSLFSVADRLVFSILLEDIRATFAFSDTELGLLGGFAFTVTYVLAGFPAARLADRSTRRTIVAGAIAFWSAMTALCGAAVGFWSLFLARTGVGVGEGCSGPASQSLIADYFRREELARAMGVLTVGATMGTVTGLVAGGLLADAFGWRWAFVLMGAPGLVIGLLVLCTVREPPRGRYALPGAELRQRPVRETLASLLGNRVFVGLALGFAVQIMIGYAMAFWMPAVMIRQFGVPVRDVALTLGLAFLAGGIPGPLLGGVLTDLLVRRDERWRAWFPGLAGLLAIVPLALALRAEATQPFLLLFALAYAMFVATQAPILSGIQAAVGPGERGMAVAVALFVNNLLGQAVGLGLIGWLSDRLSPARGAEALGLALVGVSAVAAVVALGVFGWTAARMRAGGGLPGKAG
ncbi:spinster family MFS transporter [Thermaurantiacus tibetensis]|uniref:spinster family MFS transporter n=1 Tax=Thermaurantiacus tibetensis TaxID=2759035 RepID=UPI001890058A|nr:MFS transporter [Thermaurantiacus tibetensis]